MPPVSKRAARLRRRRWSSSPAHLPAAVTHATACHRPPAPQRLLARWSSPSPLYKLLLPSLPPFRTTSSLTATSAAAVNTSSTLPAAPVVPDQPQPRRKHPCTTWSLEPPPIRRNRHQVAAWTFFPNSGRRRDFSRHLFYSELRLDSFRCELLLAPLKLPVALTCLGLLSSDPATLSCFTSPLIFVAGPSPASSPSPRHTGEFLDP